MNLHDAQQLALYLMRENGLGGTGWSVGFDGARKRYGLCDYGHKRISLSKYLVELNDEDSVRGTILHEIAHALTPSYEPSHGYAWRVNALRVGASPERCYDETVVVPLEQRRKRWVGICPACGKRHERARLPKSGGRETSASCGSCSSRFDSRYILVWTDQLNKEHHQ